MVIIRRLFFHQQKYQFTKQGANKEIRTLGSCTSNKHEQGSFLRRSFVQCLNFQQSFHFSSLGEESFKQAAQLIGLVSIRWKTCNSGPLRCKVEFMQSRQLMCDVCRHAPVGKIAFPISYLWKKMFSASSFQLLNKRIALHL